MFFLPIYGPHCFKNSSSFPTFLREKAEPFVDVPTYTKKMQFYLC